MVYSKAIAPNKVIFCFFNFSYKNRIIFENFCIFNDTLHSYKYHLKYKNKIRQCCRAAQKNGSKIKKPSHRRLTTIIYLSFGKYSIRSLHKLERGHRRRKREFQNYRQTDISQICLKRVYISSILVQDLFFENRKKLSTYKFMIKENQNYTVYLLELNTKITYFRQYFSLKSFFTLK